MNSKRRMNRSKNRKRRKESVKFLTSFDGKLHSTGSFVEWSEDKELEESGSALVVSFPLWQSCFPSNGSYALILKSSRR
jgi:hypothetical protein